MAKAKIKRARARVTVGGRALKTEVVKIEPRAKPTVKPSDLTVIVLRKADRTRSLLDVTLPLDQMQNISHPGISDAPSVAAALRTCADWLDPPQA